MARRCPGQGQCSSIVAEQLGRELLSAQMDGGPSRSMGLPSQISLRPTGSRCRSSDAERSMHRHDFAVYPRRSSTIVIWPFAPNRL